MIVAIDFDGILCANRFPEIGEPNFDVIAKVRELMDCGAEVILWTSRVERPLREALRWCEDYGLHFTLVNKAAPSNTTAYSGIFSDEPRKVYADMYIDDHNAEFLSLVAVSRAFAMGNVIAALKSAINKQKEEAANEDTKR